MKRIIASFVFVVFAALNLFAQNVTGIWQTIDDETNKPKSVVSVYEYDGRIYGRIIMTYEDDGITVKDTIYSKKYAADKVKGSPLMCGLDFIWNMKKDGPKYKGGKILNPENGKIYNSEMWCNEKGDLVVRGKIAFLGKNQTWKQFNADRFPADFTVPDSKNWQPVIPVK